MRPFSCPKFATALGMAAAAGIFASTATQSASAESGPTAIVPNYSTAIRLGAFFPFDSDVRHSAGPSFISGGIDYSFKNVPGLERTVLSVDYMKRTSGNLFLEVVPVTIGQFNYSGTRGTARPYVGFGLGPYFVRQHIIDANQVETANNGLAFGGYFAVGFDVNDRYILDARYHYVSHIGPVSAQGFQFSAGIRF